MNFRSSRIIIASALTLIAIPACDTDNAPAAQQEQQVETQERDGSTLAVELADTDLCPVSLGECLSETAVCVQGDEEDCNQQFISCRDDLVADACDSEKSVDIEASGAIQCWAQFDTCAASDSDGSSCAAALKGCVAKGSLCDIGSDTECEATLGCNTNECIEELWGWYPRFRPRYPRYPKLGNSGRGPRSGTRNPRGRRSRWGR